MAKIRLGKVLKDLGKNVLGEVVGNSPAGKVAKAVAKAVLGNENAPEEAVAEAISKDPALAERLKKLEAYVVEVQMRHEIDKMREETERMRMEVESERATEQVIAEDRANARALYMDEDTDSRFINRLAIAAFSVCFLVLLGLFFFEVPAANKDLVNIGFGTMLGWATAVIMFYFGPTPDNRRAIKALERSIQTPQEPVEPESFAPSPIAKLVPKELPAFFGEHE